VNRRERIGRLLPAPLAGIALLLVLLIIITPILQSSGQPAAGSILSQADLIVDRVAGSNVTHFYIRGVGTTTRYSVVTIEVATNFTWNGGFPTGGLNWTVASSAADTLTLVYSTTEAPLALNVSALYQVPGGSALYVGLLAFNIAPGGSGGDLLAASGSPSISVAGSTPLDSLPLIIPLANVGSGP